MIKISDEMREYLKSCEELKKAEWKLLGVVARIMFDDLEKDIMKNAK